MAEPLRFAVRAGREMTSLGGRKSLIVGAENYDRLFLGAVLGEIN